MTTDKIKDDLIKSFKKLHFDEETHTYKVNGKVLTSTTTYIEKFSQEFNSYYASENKAKKIIQANPNDTRTAQYYRKRWEYINKEATNMGSRIHMFAECYPNFDEPMCNGEQGVVDFFNWIPKHYEVLFLEFRLYDEDTLRAGTIDGLLLNTKTNKLVIFDFKTNKRNILEYYTGKKLKDPFGDLYSTNLNKYSLQLSDYMWMIEKNTNYEIEERWIIWLKEGSVEKKCRDRADAYKIDKVRPSFNKKFFKLFKVRDYSKQLRSDNTCIDGLPDRRKDRKKKK